ncbi:hypothetical protein BC943DRAFT_322131 [Umbelopsis sp. AD052]|nr:hypothetical protein BC943DRAFT_322131 [Umbelopsis sp. AD052]
MSHQSLKLYINDETFTVVPEFYDPEVSREVIVINRSTGTLECTSMLHRFLLFDPDKLRSF